MIPKASKSDEFDALFGDDMVPLKGCCPPSASALKKQGRADASAKQPLDKRVYFPDTIASVVSAPARPPPAPAPAASISPPLRSPCRILVCAPSNAAVDEIVLRLVTVGVWNSSGDAVNPRVVRIGMCSSPNPAVNATTVDSKLEAYLGLTRASVATAGRFAQQLTRLLDRLDSIKAATTNVQAALSSLSEPLEPSAQRSFEGDLERLEVDRMSVVSQLFTLQAKLPKEQVLMIG